MHEGSAEQAAPGPRRTDRFQEKHKHIRGRGLISSMVLGLSDGLITNLSFLMGFGGAVAGIGLIRFAGLAVMLAGAASMFFGGILGARYESALYEADSKREAFEIEHEPDEEKAELFDIYRQKGLTEEEAETVVTRVSSNKAWFLEDMLLNEVHISRTNLQTPFRIGAAIGLSFMAGAAIPLVPYYLLGLRTTAALASVVLSLAFLFAAGMWKGRIAMKSMWKSGLETLLVGAFAALLLFLIGRASTFV
jgi:predicted membrane protein (TIGR00267 family)